MFYLENGRRPAAPTRRRTRHLPPAASGYTLLELSLVLAVLAVTVALTLPRIDSTTWRMNGAARELAGLLRRARQSAVRQQHDVIVTFDAVANDIVIHENSDNDPAGEVANGERVYRRHLPQGVAWGAAGAPALRGRSGSPASFKSATVLFHANGAASESGVVFIAPDRAETRVEEVRALWVERATGSVQVLRYRDSAWQRL